MNIQMLVIFALEAGIIWGSYVLGKIHTIEKFMEAARNKNHEIMRFVIEVLRAKRKVRN